MNIQKATLPVFRFCDSMGVPLAGGRLCTFAGGKPVATYKDSSGTLNDVEVPLNSNGECSVWLDSAIEYKFVWYDRDGKYEGTADHVTTNTRTFKAECNDGTMDVVESEEDGVTTYTFGLKDNSIAWGKLKEPRHLIADTDWVEFEPQPNSDYVVVSLAPALRTFLEGLGYDG